MLQQLYRNNFSKQLMKLLTVIIFLIHVCFISSQSYSTGFFTNMSSQVSSLFGGWLTPNPSGTQMITYQFLDSQGNQVFGSSYITNFSIQIFNQTYASNHSAIISIGNLSSYYQKSDNSWILNSTLGTVQRIGPNNTVESEYDCLFGGSFQVSDYLGLSQIFVYNNTDASDNCYIVVGVANVYYTYPSSTLTIYFAMYYILLIGQSICVALLLFWKWKKQVNFRRISPVAMSVMCMYVSNRNITFGNFFSPTYGNNFEAFFVLNILLYLALVCVLIQIVKIVFQTKKMQLTYLFSFMSVNILFVLVAVFVFQFNFWSYLFVPALIFISQSVRNYILRKTRLQIYYTYYLGLIGANFIESMYYFTCPNIFLLPFQLSHVLIWVGMWLAIIIGFFVQFRFIFRPVTYKINPEIAQNFGDLLSDRIGQIKLLKKQNVRFSELSNIRGLAGNLQNRHKQDFFLQLTYDILNLDKAILVTEIFDQKANEPPDCAICYSFITEDVEAIDGSKINREPFKELIIKTDCRHYFHYECTLLYWLDHKRACPICRRPVTQLNIQNIIKAKQEKDAVVQKK